MNPPAEPTNEPDQTGPDQPEPDQPEPDQTGPDQSGPGAASEVMVSLTIDGWTLSVEEGSSVLDACTRAGIDTPTLCWAPNLTPVNACRLCVVEQEGSRTLIPACSRSVEEGMVIHTDSERVRHSRRMVIEFLGSGVDLSQGQQGLGHRVCRPQ